MTASKAGVGCQVCERTCFSCSLTELKKKEENPLKLPVVGHKKWWGVLSGVHKRFNMLGRPRNLIQIKHRPDTYFHGSKLHRVRYVYL